MLTFTPLWLGLVGYSLAGLFSLYAATRTPLFARIASVSGSMWYWGFADYLYDNPPLSTPDCVYLSLGDREGLAKDALLATVEPYTDGVYRYLAERGYDVTYERTEGNHFCEPEARMVKGIRHLLNATPKELGTSPTE